VCTADPSGEGVVVGGDMVLIGPGKPVEVKESFTMPTQPKKTQQQTATSN
jgi:hypothetical protein